MRLLEILLFAFIGVVWSQGASTIHPVDFDGDGDIDIVRSTAIGVVWMENLGNNEWETHVISLSPAVQKSVDARKKEKIFLRAMEEKWSTLEDEVVEEDEVEVVVSFESEVAIGGDGGAPPPPFAHVRYASAEL